MDKLNKVANVLNGLMIAGVFLTVLVMCIMSIADIEQSAVTQGIKETTRFITK